MLAVVDDFSGAGMFVRRSASAEEGALLKQRDVEPASDRAQAAASPARPPPAMATVRLGMSQCEMAFEIVARFITSATKMRHRDAPVFSREALEEAFPEDPKFSARGQSNFRGEDVVLFLGDFFQQAAIDVDQHPQSAGWLSSEM